MTPPNADPCSAARRWLSADRDGEAPDDPGCREHAATCPACRAWAADTDRIVARMRLRPATTPDVTSAAISAYAAAAGAEASGRRPAASRRQPGGPRWVDAHPATPWHPTTAVRALLVLAGLSGLALSALTVALGGLIDPAGHAHTDVAAFEAALSAGFLLAAHRPERYVPGLLPVAVGVSAVIMVSFVVLLGAGAAGLRSELSHLPIMLGAAALVALSWQSPHRAGGASLRRHARAA